MALQVADVSGRPPAVLAGGRALQTFELTFDTDYPTGGYTFDEDTIGWDSIESVSCDGPTGGYVPAWIPATGKLMLMIGNYDASDGPLIDATAGDNGIDTLTLRVAVIGTLA